MKGSQAFNSSTFPWPVRNRIGCSRYCMAQRSLQRPRQSQRFAGNQQTSARHIWTRLAKKTHKWNIHSVHMEWRYAWIRSAHEKQQTEHTGGFQEGRSGLKKRKHSKRLTGTLNTPRSRCSAGFNISFSVKTINGFCGLVRTDYDYLRGYVMKLLTSVDHRFSFWV